MAYTIDVYLSVVLGRPRHIHDDDVDQSLPDAVRDENQFWSMSADLSNVGDKLPGLEDLKATIRAEVAEQVKVSVNEALQPLLAALGKEREALHQERLGLERLHAELRAALDKSAQ